MASWPELDEVKQLLDVTSTDWDGDADGTRLTRLLAAAIDHTKREVGHWDADEDEPTDAMAQAALRMAELLALKPEANTGEVAKDGTYRRLLFGQRRRFGIA